MIPNCLRPRRPIGLVIYLREFKTLKSKDDEHNSQDLLKRLRKLAVTSERRPTPRPVKANDDQLRCMDFDRLKKLLRFYQSDPLIWNPSVLGRIFKVPEHHCENIVAYVKPMVFFATNEYDTVQRMMKTTFVVDVGRMKFDDNYLINYKKIVFPNQKHHD